MSEFLLTNIQIIIPTYLSIGIIIGFAVLRIGDIGTGATFAILLCIFFWPIMLLATFGYFIEGFFS